MTDTSATLAQFIADHTGHAAEVRDLKRIPGGFSYETWSLRALWQDASGRHDERTLSLANPLDHSGTWRRNKRLIQI